MAIVRRGEYLSIETICPGNPLFLSQKNADELYGLIRKNRNLPEFVVKRSKPDVCIYNNPRWVAFIYDVTLFGEHLCKIYEDGYSFCNVQYYKANTVEIQ